MTSIPEKYPEIPSLFLSAIVACVGTEKLDAILREYMIAKEYMKLVDEEQKEIGRELVRVIRKAWTPKSEM